MALFATSHFKGGKMEKREKRYRNPAQRRGIQRLLMVKLIQERQKNLKKAARLYILNRFREKRCRKLGIK